MMHANFGVGLKRISMPDFTGKFIHLLYHHLKQLIIKTKKIKKFKILILDIAALRTGGKSKHHDENPQSHFMDPLLRGDAHRSLAHHPASLHPNGGFISRHPSPDPLLEPINTL
jgi:hypothetical protein